MFGFVVVLNPKSIVEDWRRKFWRPSGAKRWSYTHRTPGMLRQVHWVLSSLIEVLLGNLGNAMACDGICMMVTCRIAWCETVPVNPVRSKSPCLQSESSEGFLTLGHTIFVAGEVIAFYGEFLGANLHIPTASFSRSQPSRNLPALWCFEPLAASCASWPRWCEDPENVRMQDDIYIGVSQKRYTSIRQQVFVGSLTVLLFWKIKKLEMMAF